ncbi:hypothetical protein [Paenibacillus naphthalenovorans]|uniref:hypothetical protein n=1 Tax=Paenibacillus naphthalenovorans TaxID=162209 RepID=UPI003D2E596A
MSDDPRKISRALTIGINVNDARKLPQAGRHLAAFLKSVDHDHGPFDINVVVSVEPTVTSAIGPVELPADDGADQTVEVIMLGGDFDGLTEGAD